MFLTSRLQWGSVRGASLCFSVGSSCHQQWLRMSRYTFTPLQHMKFIAWMQWIWVIELGEECSDDSYKSRMLANPTGPPCVVVVWSLGTQERPPVCFWTFQSSNRQTFIIYLLCSCSQRFLEGALHPFFKKVCLTPKYTIFKIRSRALVMLNLECRFFFNVVCVALEGFLDPETLPAPGMENDTLN